VTQTIASAIGIREAPQRSIRELLLDNLRRRQLLLVLDNCEHLIDACAELAEEMLRAAPALRMIATSREPLRVPGETVWRVASLSDVEATRLFVERATAIDATFRATEETAATIARICRRLDGIPLAIELAAARINALSVDQIDERLQDRFRLLTGGARTALARQRTLEATVQWSYQLLSEQERVLLSRLSVFPAGWTLEAAEQVCGGDGIDEGDMLDLLSRLVNKSLVTLESQAGADRRYRLLETVRQYARERLVEMGSADRLRAKHFEFFFNEFRGAQTALQGHEQVRGLKRLRLEQDSVRAALEWAIAPGTADKALELTGALFWYWTKNGAFAEGRQWLERALALNPDVRGSVRARALIGLGHMFYFQGHMAEVADLSAEALPLARAEGDTWATVFALFPQALAAFEQGNHDSAATFAAAACEAARANEELEAGPLLVLGNLAMLSGDVDRAQQLFDRSNDLNRRAGEIWGLGIGLLIAAGLRIMRQDFESARAHALEALSFNQELEDPRGIAWTIETLAGLLAVRGDHGAAVRLWAASDRLLENAGLPPPPFIRWLRDRHEESVKTSLGPEQLQTALAEGRALSSEEAIAFARHRVLTLR
jgi:non-specific serine/threonine protein kinase